MKKFLVILDLNGTLLESTHRRKEAMRYDLKARCKYVYFRPYMWQFIEQLSHNPAITIAVWTSCKRENGQAIIDRIFKGIKLEFFYAREECVELSGYKTIKDLSIVWKRFPQWNEKNTIIIDDSMDKLQRHPNNLLHVPEYFAEMKSSDCILFSLYNTIEAHFSEGAKQDVS